MTEFEMAYLVTDMQIAVSTTSATLFTITSAFLLAGYYVAHRLTPLMIGVLIVIYAWSFFGTAFMLNREFISLFGLAGEINTYAGAGKGLHWHAAANPAPAWLLNTGIMLGAALNVVIFVATLIFFFHCRRVNRKAETEAPKVAA
jgi:heme/copper-type cytochrome/quinol oxidase subunit 2